MICYRTCRSVFMDDGREDLVEEVVGTLERVSGLVDRIRMILCREMFGGKRWNRFGRMGYTC